MPKQQVRVHPGPLKHLQPNTKFSNEYKQPILSNRSKRSSRHASPRNYDASQEYQQEPPSRKAQSN